MPFKYSQTASIQLFTVNQIFEPRLTQKDINMIADKMSDSEIIQYK